MQHKDAPNVNGNKVTATMKKFKIASVVAVLAIIAALALATASHARESDQDDDFKWQEASRELDALAFPQRFIDSVTRVHVGDPAAQRGLRRVGSGQFARGETLVYEVSWGLIKGGYLILSVEPQPARGMLRISSKAMTNNFVSAIYRVRDFAISWVDAGGLYPIFFEHHVREGARYRMDAYIAYDHVNNRLFNRRRGDAVEHDVHPFTHDFLSILYYTRTMPLTPGGSFTASIFSRPEAHSMRFRVNSRRETIQVGAGTFNCVKVEPVLVGESRVFNRRDRMEVWVSDDENRYPVMVKSKIKVGSITARLIQVSR